MKRSSVRSAGNITNSDAGWVVRAGLDPVEYINRYAGRVPLIHMKECAYPATDFEDLEHFPAKVLQMGEPK